MSVPAADEAVLAWMELQENPSLSVRMLIRESIERQGYIDIVNRPVSRLPKRGHPAGSPEEARAVEEDVPEAQAQIPISDSAPRPGAVVPAPVHQSQPAVPAPALHEPEQSTGEQLDVNDIFSMTR
ncbi:hypothetical protein ACETK3_18465 [Arthrobacter sp. E44]|uniref:hypothetical protein n=1 Tax=Arthrobacter sp. E44 TaxID=3341794 RepID=UPI0035A60A9B